MKLRVRDITHGERIAARAIVMQQKSAVRCLGVEVDDALEMAEQTEV